MHRKAKLAIAAGALVAVGAGVGGSVAFASSGDDASHPIPRGALERASAAALAATNGGRVTGTEVDDEESKYEVEVTLPDGRQVDVQLDDSFAVVKVMGDHEEKSDTGDR
jgi:hypothetical protein